MTGSEAHLGDLLSALLDGELTATEEVDATRHLDACARCTAELDAVGTARSWVRHLPEVDPPAGFFEGMLRQGAYVAPGARRAAARRQRRRQVAAVAASAVAAVALLGLVPPREAPVSPAVNRLVEAHAAGASVGSDPLSRLAPIGVPVTFRR